MLSNKKRDTVVSDHDDEYYDDDYEEDDRSDDDLLRKIGILCIKCKEYKSIVKRLRWI
jgi:hypothetical protein